MESSMTPPAAGGAVPAELAPPVPDLTNGGPEVASDAAQTPAEQLGLIDGQIKAESSESGIEGGWSVHSVFESTNKKTGALETVVAISKPKLGPDGKQIVGEEGPEFDYKVYTPDKLLALQTPANPEAAEANEAEVAVEEMGEVAVKDEVEVVPQNRVTGADLIQAQLDDRENWVEHRVKVPPVETPVEEPTKRNRVEEARDAAESDSTEAVEAKAETAKEPVEASVAETAKAETDEAAVESEPGVDEAESEEQLDAGETSEVMNEYFDRIESEFAGLEEKFMPVNQEISRLPGRLTEAIGDFERRVGNQFEDIGNTLRGVKNLVAGLEDSASFIRRLDWEEREPVDQRDITSLRQLTEAVEVGVRQLNSLRDQVWEAQRGGMQSQDAMAEDVRGSMRRVIGSIEEFQMTGTSRIRSAVDAAGSVLGEHAMNSVSEDARTEDTEAGVTEADETYLDMANHEASTIHKETMMLQTIAEDTQLGVSRRIGPDTINVVQDTLNQARLRPTEIEDVISTLQSVGRALDYAPTRGTKGQLLAELGYGVPARIQEVVETVMRMMPPEIRGSEAAQGLRVAENQVGELMDATSRYNASLRNSAQAVQRR